jgi:hypothetical protein
MPQPERAVSPDYTDNVMQGLTRNHEQEVREDISLGIEAKKFLTSDLVKHITYIAEGKVIAAQQGLANCDPHDAKTVANHQTTIARYDLFFGCLQEIVAAGDTAYQVYLQLHSDD